MNDRLKQAFHNIRAEEALKNRTKAFLYHKTNGYTKKRTVPYHRLIPAIACFLLVMFGGYWLYFTPTVAISIDVNPSIELGVNRFDRVISVQGYNADGQTLADSLDIKYQSYTEAVNQILSNEAVTALLADNEVMTIGVIGSNDAQSAKILSEIQSCTAGEANTYCYYADSDEVKKAHEMGLSYGKYRAFVALQALDPAITVAEIQDMTMREIRDLMDSLSGQPDTETGGNHGFGRGQGHRRGAER